MTHTYPIDVLKKEGLRYWTIKQGRDTIASCHHKECTTQESIDKLTEAYEHLKGNRVTLSIFAAPPAQIKRGEARTNNPIYTWQIDIPGYNSESKAQHVAPSHEHGMYSMLITQMQHHNEAMRLEMEKRHELQLELIRQQAERVKEDEEHTGLDTNKLIELIGTALPHLLKGGGAAVSEQVKTGWNDVIHEFESMGGTPADFEASIKQMKQNMSRE